MADRINHFGKGRVMADAFSNLKAAFGRAKKAYIRKKAGIFRDAVDDYRYWNVKLGKIGEWKKDCLDVIGGGDDLYAEGEFIVGYVIGVNHFDDIEDMDEIDRYIVHSSPLNGSGDYERDFRENSGRKHVDEGRRRHYRC